MAVPLLRSQERLSATEEGTATGAEGEIYVSEQVSELGKPVKAKEKKGLLNVRPSVVLSVPVFMTTAVSSRVGKDESIAFPPAMPSFQGLLFPLTMSCLLLRLVRASRARLR